MLKLNKLKHYETIADLSIGELYIGTVLENNLIALNDNIKAKIKGDKKPLSKEVAFKVLKISLPFFVEGEIINGDYEIIDEQAKGFAAFTVQDIGLEYLAYCEITRIAQTSGPTLFSLFDGTGTIIAKSFVGPGKRAFPDLNEKDAIKAKIKIIQRNDVLEAEFLSFERLIENKERQLLNKIEKKMSEQANPINVDFLIKSDYLEKLRPRIISVAREIKKSILESRPIILRHHADADGYIGAIALERAILPLIFIQHKDDLALYRYFSRRPSRSPFYDYEDAIKDLSISLEDIEKYGYKEPLIIVVDNGSTQEDILSLKKLKIFGFKLVVIDHHYPGDANVDEIVDAHVNPYLVGGDSNLCAGMLCSETARFINTKIENISKLPAIAGMADRCKGKEFENYLTLSELSVDEIRTIAEVLDFDSYFIRYSESRVLFNDILGQNIENQKKIIDLLKDDIEQRKKVQLETAKHYMKIEVQVNKSIITLNLDKITGRGNYPPPGKIVGMVKDSFEGKNVVVMGLAEDYLTLRISDGINVNINHIIKYLQKKMPYAQIEGGGHERAGTIKFIPAAKEDLYQTVKEYFKEI